MSQVGFTPISIYYSATASNVPTAGNLVAGELAINTADGKLFYKDSSGVVQTIASKSATAGTYSSITTSNLTIGTTQLGAGDASIMKNRIINGAMVINQRAFSGTAVTSAYTLDRWNVNSIQAGKFSVSQSSTAPTGFSNSLLATSLSAYTVTTNDYFTIFQPIEGYNMADLGWGSASAKTITLSFQVYSSLTGTFGGSIINASANRSYPFSYSIPIANTWTTVSVTVAGDTTGTWTGATNGVGMYVNFSLGAGTSASGTAGTWASAFYASATGATSVVGTNGATFYITGVQLEVGSSATGFEYRQYTTELALCQRYYWRNNDPTATSTFIPCGNGYIFNSTTGTFQLSFPVTMRTRVATINFSNVRVYGAANASSGVVTSISGIQSTNTVFQADVAASSATFVVGTPAQLQGNNNTAAFVEFSAEL